MKKLENKCMLITYSDSMGHNLADLNEILDKYFKKSSGRDPYPSVLPFFGRQGICTDGLPQSRSGIW